jgi:serine O-acetyltransferase
MISTWNKIKSDFEAVFEMDPAATSKLEVVLTYSGFHAILAYRFAHWLYKHRIPFFPRFLSQVARFLTGVEIHPAAQIGHRFFIDHGMGVVIGETTEIGDNVTLYQGVTLGGTGKEQKKRHPTIGNNVVVGTGAKILGSMMIGDNVKVGANAVVLTPVPPNSTVIGVPGRIVKIEGEKVRSSLDHIHLPDPVMERLQEMEDEIAALREKLKEEKEV